MTAVDTVILALLGTGLIFSIIELGISAYVVHGMRGVYLDGVYESRFDFLLFCSIWTILVCVFLLVIPMMSGKKPGSYKWIVITTLALNSITMLFWLGGFAAYADFWRWSDLRGTLAAELAFAVMLWLIFLTLLVLNILTALSVVRSNRLGYAPMQRNRTLP